MSGFLVSECRKSGRSCVNPVATYKALKSTTNASS